MSRILLLFVMFFVGFAFSAIAQRTVTGTVTDDTGETLPGVNVVIKGTSTGTTTDVNGSYSLSVPNNAVLVFSYVGFENQEVEVGARSVIDVSLGGVTELQEVLVVGYGEQSQRFSTQSVSTVTAANIKNLPVLSAQEALQGQAAGVQMVGSSGIIGARPTVRIRGVASLEGAEPLYVIDGVPLVNVDNSLNAGGTEMNPLATINPSEIESVSVLKDAAAVAIYGSRGSNGVILINTKKGKRNQETVFSADVFTGWVEATQEREMMNADQYREYSANAYVGQGDDPNKTPADFRQTSFDWPGAVLRTGRTTNYSLSARGGSENTSFYVGGTYFQQEGFTIGNEGDRINFRLNMDHSATDNLRFGANVGITRLEFDRLFTENSTFAPLTSAYLQVPWVEPADENGEFINTGFIANVIGIEATSIFLQIQRRTTGNVYVEWDILEGLTAKSDFGVDIGQNEETQRYPDVFSPGGSGYKRIFQDNKHLITNTLRYNKDINDDMRFSILAGHSYEINRNEIIAVEGNGFVSDQLPNVASASTPTITSATGNDWAIESMFSRLNYSFLDRYLFEATVRRDGSSRFGTNNRYGNFWAVSGGWILSEESFLSGIDAINLLKLKVSYGTSGNDQMGGNFRSLGLYGAGNIPSYNGNAGIEPSNPSNPDLTWEETTQLDVTLTAGLFDNRVSLEASYYIKDTDGFLLDVPLPQTTGFTSRTENIGEVRNKGIDLAITGDIVRSSDFSIRSTLNLGFLNNEVTSLPDDNQDIQGNNFVGGSDSQRAIQGHSINQFYLINYVGIDPATGEAQWLDADGEITNAPVADDRQIQGSAIPDLSGSFRTEVRYQDFDLGFLFTFVQGNEVFLSDMRFSDNPDNFDSFGLSTRLLDTWQQPGDVAYAPGFEATTFSTFAQRSTQQLFDGSYVRLKNITLGYSMPNNFLDNTFIDRARVYVMGTNLWTFASDLWDFGVEPEVNGGASNPQIQGESFFAAPMARTISVGVSLGF